MTKKKDIEKQIEFIKQLLSSELKSPNDFTVEMGKLIRQAREEKGLSQAQLAKEMNKHQGAISDIENGKYEIGTLTLVQFAIKLQKPITYFFATPLLIDWIPEIKNPFEHDVQEIAKYLGSEEEVKLTSNMLKVLKEYLYTQRDMELHPEDYDLQPPDDEDE